MTLHRSAFAASAAAGAATVALLAGPAVAEHVTISAPPGSVPVVVAPAPVVIEPAPVAVMPQTLQVEDIRANHVRAQTIYANQIDADQVQGMLHQSNNIRIRDAKGEIKAPMVTAAVIYADSIKANTVVADQIYVRDLKLKR